MADLEISATCACGATYAGSTWKYDGWREDHSAAHAERIVLMQSTGEAPTIAPLPFEGYTSS